MPAYLVDPLDEAEDGVPALADDVTSSSTPQTPEPYRLDGDSVPEKYRGKTPEELLKVLEDQEKFLGRRNQEYGELKRRNEVLSALAERMALGEGTDGRPAQQEVDLTDDDFSLRPKEAVVKTVETRTQALQDDVAALRQQARVAAFEKAHPTASADLNDPAFVEFVQSSKYRTRLAAKAFGDTANIDFEAAEELWDAWEETRGNKPPVTEEPPAATPASSSAPDPTSLSLVTGGGASPSNVSSAGKPIYSASKLQALQEAKPDEYWSARTQKLIQDAYREGRVVD